MPAMMHNAVRVTQVSSALARVMPCLGGSGAASGSGGAMLRAMR